MQDTFVREMTVRDALAQDVWPLLRDVELLASCSSAVENEQETTPGTAWTVDLIRKVGRFRLAAPLTVAIVGEEEGRALRIQARGTDRKIGTRLDVEASMELETVGDTGVRLTLQGGYEVTGRIASLGSGIVRRHATELIDEFCQGFVSAVEQRTKQATL
jgi:carbon monoxide dehydrogenase subunit G